jgi:protein phosphatase
MRERGMSQPASNVDRLFSGAATHRGRGHDVNEDSFGLPVGVSDAVAAQKGRLYVVSDGIGGHQAGDVASKIAVDTVQRVYYEDPSPTHDVALQRAVKTANEAIYRRAQDPGYADMGATIVAAVVRGNELTVAHVGDSRVYLLRQGQLQALTADHSWVADQVRSGTLTPAEAANHNMRHVVTRSLGSSSTVEVDVAQFVLHEGDRLLLCSDGIWELVSEDEVRHFLRRGAPRGAAQALVDRAVAAGVPDDATALVVSVGDPRSGVLAQVESAVTSLMATQEGRIGAVLVGAFLVVALLFFGAMKAFRGLGAQEAHTITPPSPTRTATPVPTHEPTESSLSPTPTSVTVMEATPTLAPEDESVSIPEGCQEVRIENAGFENERGWHLDRAEYDSTRSFSGSRSIRIGGTKHGMLYTSFYQVVDLSPYSGTANLSYQVLYTGDNLSPYMTIVYDQRNRQDVLDPESPLPVPFDRWQRREYDVTEHLGERWVKIYIGSSGDRSGEMYIDDVHIIVCPDGIQ